jgi:hypothetical protein
VVVVIAAAIVLGIRIGSTPTTPTSPKTSPAPSTAHAPAQGSFVIDRQVLNDGSLALTLTTIKLRDSLMTVYVSYRSVTGFPEPFSFTWSADNGSKTVPNINL